MVKISITNRYIVVNILCLQFEYGWIRMESIHKEYVISYFNRTLSSFGDRPEAAGWSAGRQTIRYSDHVVLRQGSIPHEITLFVYREG